MLRLLMTITVLFSFVGMAAAQAPTRLSEHKDWTAFTGEFNGERLCYIMTQPTRKRGAYTRRGEVYAMVTHRPGDGARGEFSIQTGYEYDTSRDATIRIGNRSFEMFTRGENAWARIEDEPDLITAMRRGSRMLVTAFSSRGTKTSDTYSLLGFTAALQAIDRACNVR